MSFLVHGLWKGEERRIMIAGDAIREDLARSGYYWSLKVKPGESESVMRVLKNADVIIPGHHRVLKQEAIGELLRLFTNVFGS